MPVSVDTIYGEVRSRALANFNKEEAAKKIGHWPDDKEAIEYFLHTKYGYPDALRAVGVQEYGATTFVPPQERCSH